MLRDGGWVGYKDYVSSLSGHRVDEKTLYMHYKFVYNIQDQFFIKMREKSHQAICNFLERMGTKKINGKYDITVSIDGSYPRRGFTSKFCATFLFESITGTCFRCHCV